MIIVRICILAVVFILAAVVFDFHVSNEALGYRNLILKKKVNEYERSVLSVEKCNKVSILLLIFLV